MKRLVTTLVFTVAAATTLSAGPIAPNAALTGNSVYVSVEPCRIADTRNPDGPYGGPAMVAQTARTFDIVNGPCTGIPANATAYALTFGVVNPVRNGFMVGFPTGGAMPNSATVAWEVANTVRSTTSIVAAGTDGKIDIFSSCISHLGIDITGYFVDMPTGGTGTITEVLAGTGLAGGGNTGSVTLGIANGGVDTLQLADASVETAKIATGAVTSNEILDGTIDTIDIKDLAVTTPKLAAKSVTAAKIDTEAAGLNSALVSDGAGNATWANVVTAVNNSKVHEVDAGNLCTVAGGFTASSITLGGINGAAGANAVVVVTPNGGNDTYPTTFPQVAVAFVPNTTLTSTCAGNKWVVYSLSLTEPLTVGMKFNVMGLR